MSTVETIDDALPEFLADSSPAMSDWDSVAIDDVLDHLAQGEVYAEHGVTAMYAQHAREVSDVTDAFAEISTEGFDRNQDLSETDRFHRERYKGAVYVPKMKAETKVMVTTVLLLMSIFAMMSALAAYAVTYLTAAIRNTYTDTAPSIEEQPVSTAVLLSDGMFSQLIERYPEQIVSLYLKRARALHKEKKWLVSIEAYKTAELHSVYPIPVIEQLDHVQCLIGAKRIDAALEHLSQLDFEAMGEEEQARATALLGRLHFAVD